MPDEHTYDVVMGLLRDPSFAAAATAGIRDYVSWDELADRHVPGGLTVRETWGLLSAIRRFGGFAFPVPVATGEVPWYSITLEGRCCLRTIERHCRSDSRLHQMVKHRTGRRFLVRSHIREAIATCQLDGIEADHSELERVLQEGRSPGTPESRLVTNTYEMLGELDSLTGEEFTPDLVRHLFDRATHGVDLDRLKRSDAALPGVPSVFRDLMTEYPPRAVGTPSTGPADAAEEALQLICDYANGKTGDHMEPCAARGYMLLASMGYWGPLPDLNATVARHMFRLLAARHDYPVLGYLPTSVMMRRWALGQMDPGTVRFSTIERGAAISGEIDCTAEMLVHLQLTVAAIDEVMARIQAAKDEDHALDRALSDTGRLNYRQRAVIGRALRRPETEFTVRQHQLAHHTVYSTALADMVELVELGYLCRATRGRAFVFTPAADLREQLGRSHDSAAEGDR